MKKLSRKALVLTYQYSRFSSPNDNLWCFDKRAQQLYLNTNLQPWQCGKFIKYLEKIHIFSVPISAQKEEMLSCTGLPEKTADTLHFHGASNIMELSQGGYICRICSFFYKTPLTV